MTQQPRDLNDDEGRDLTAGLSQKLSHENRETITRVVRQLDHVRHMLMDVSEELLKVRDRFNR